MVHDWPLLLLRVLYGSDFHECPAVTREPIELPREGTAKNLILQMKNRPNLAQTVATMRVFAWVFPYQVNIGFNAFAEQIVTFVPTKTEF